MNGVDDGPDGLNDAAFDRMLGLSRRKRPAVTARDIRARMVRAARTGDKRLQTLCEVALGDQRSPPAKLARAGVEATILNERSAVTP